ncbi:MAG: T9SS type A sorting domain-containing protein [Bacteroidota bacterium]
MMLLGTTLQTQAQCSAGFVEVTSRNVGYANGITATSVPAGQNPGNVLGVPDANYATMTGAELIYLDLGDTIPAGDTVQVNLAATTTSVFAIYASTDGSSVISGSGVGYNVGTSFGYYNYINPTTTDARYIILYANNSTATFGVADLVYNLEDTTCLIDSDGDLIADLNDFDDNGNGLPDTVEMSQDCSNQLAFDFSGAVYESGKYRFTAVIPGVDALISGVDSSNIVVNAFDNDASNSARFQPELRPAVDGEFWIEYQIEFVATGTSTPYTIKNLNAIAVDTDGTTSGTREKVGYKDFETTVLENPTYMGKSIENGFTMYTGPTLTFDGISLIDTEVKTVATFYNKSTIMLRLGGENGVTTNTRLFSISFDPCDVDGFTNPAYTGIEYAILTDSDGDGIFNHLDLDADNDGIPNIIEAGGVDANGDGLVDDDTDTDGDGLADTYDTDNLGNSLPALDSDGDGIKDFLDLDADGDGIPDIIEAKGIDSDGDGRVDVDMTNVANDADRDGFADIYDSDDDGTAGIDAGEANQPLVKSTDSGSDGLLDAMTDGEGKSLDTDNDGLADLLDIDADNDGLPDLIEARGIDSDGDGRVDNNTDADGDGLADVYDADATDGPAGSGTNGTPLVRTAGTDTDGDYKADDLAIVWEHGSGADLDVDGDGYPEFIDLDADNDGIPDLIESLGVDANGDGRVDAATDTDGDGLADIYDSDAADGPSGTGTNGTPLIQTSGTDTGADGYALGDGGINYVNGSSSGLPDLDGDNIPNYVDLDADNDGLLDVTEAGATDSNRDGIADGTTDADGDGLLDVYDPAASDGPGGSGTNGTPLMTVAADGVDTDARGEYADAAGTSDSDGDDVPDFLDVDSDNDGIFDVYEAQSTTGYVSLSGTDSDGDGIDDNYDDDDVNFGGISAAGLVPINTDGTGNPDYIDTDADDDNVPDIQEAWDSVTDGDSQPDGVTGSCEEDTDGDGLVDCFDSDDGNVNVYTISLNPPTDDGSGGANGSSSVGVDPSASSEMDDIFPANNLNGGADNTQPDYRDGDNADCSASVVWYAVTDGDTTSDYHWISGSNLNQQGANTGVVRASAFCEKAGGWYRFYNPLQSDNYILSIQNGTNTEPLENVIDYVEVKTVPAPVRNDDGSEGVVLMRRAWFIATKGSLNGTVNVRFYYPEAEFDALSDSATALASDLGGTSDIRWFKTDDGVDYTSVPTSFSGYTDNYVNLTTSVSSQNDASGDVQDGGNSKNYVQFDGMTSFSGGTLGSQTTGSLPVDLLSIDADFMGDKIEINWTTSQEVNTDYFEVQRSYRAGVFEKIGTSQAAGNSDVQRSYNFADLSFDRNTANTISYRIKMVDQDGAYSYSSLVEVNPGEQAILTNVYPNPVEDMLHVELSLSAGQTARMHIVDTQGRLVWQQNVKGATGNENLQISTQAWSAGLYQLVIKDSAGKLSYFKFSKN